MPASHALLRWTKQNCLDVDYEVLETGYRTYHLIQSKRWHQTPDMNTDRNYFEEYFAINTVIVAVFDDESWVECCVWIES